MLPHDGHHYINRPGFHLDAWGNGPLVLRYAGKDWWFEFSEMFGPVLLTRQGVPSTRQPNRDDHPFWEPFQRWMDAGRKCRAVRSKRGKLRFYLCHIQRHETLY